MIIKLITILVVEKIVHVDNPKKINWEELKNNEPFFQVVNFMSHMKAELRES